MLRVSQKITQQLMRNRSNAQFRVICSLPNPKTDLGDQKQKKTNNNHNKTSADQKSLAKMDEKATKIAKRITSAALYAQMAVPVVSEAAEKISTVLVNININYVELAVFVSQHQHSVFFGAALIIAANYQFAKAKVLAGNRKVLQGVRYMLHILRGAANLEHLKSVLNVMKKLILDPEFRAQAISYAAKFLDLKEWHESLAQFGNIGLERLWKKKDNDVDRERFTRVDFMEVHPDGYMLGRLQLAPKDWKKNFKVYLRARIITIVDEDRIVMNSQAVVPTGRFLVSKVMAKMGKGDITIIFPLTEEDVKHNVLEEVEVPFINPN